MGFSSQRLISNLNHYFSLYYEQAFELNESREVRIRNREPGVRSRTPGYWFEVPGYYYAAIPSSLSTSRQSPEDDFSYSLHCSHTEYLGFIIVSASYQCTDDDS